VVSQSNDLQGITVLAVDPGGLVDSRAFHGNHIPLLWYILISFVNFIQPIAKFLKPTLRRSSEAAKDVVEFAVGQQYAGQDGHFLMNKKEDSSPESKDEEVQAALWAKSLEWCKLEQKDTVLPL
jgi:hypothetical protein